MAETETPRPWTGELTSAALEQLGATSLRRADPTDIGPYRVLARLGGGGMGRLYLGREATLDGGGAYGTEVLVAVKVIRSEYAEDEPFRRRFEREVDAVRRVHGRYTAELLGSGFDEEEERLWMATSYVPGLSLSAAVERFGPMPEPMVWRLAHEIAQALVSLAAAGIVHRDLKPSNVLLAADGARVIDFGIAHTTDTSALTLTGQQVGTPAFMSPEQADGGEVGPASDVFSLGSVLTLAATGNAPFGTGSSVDVLHRVIHKAPDASVFGQIADADRALTELVGRCLEKSPADRPTPQEVLDTAQARQSAQVWPEPVMQLICARAAWHGVTAAESPMDQPTILRRPVPKPTTTSTTPKRRRRVLLAAAAAFATGVALVAFLVPGAGNAPVGEHTTPSAHRQSAPVTASPAQSDRTPARPPRAHSPDPAARTTPKESAAAPVQPPADARQPTRPRAPRTATVTAKPPARAPAWKSCTFYSGTALTRYGDQGKRVSQVQCILDKRGYNIGAGGVDGMFGADTRAAVKRFQSAHRLEIDGEVGPYTWAELRG